MKIKNPIALIYINKVIELVNLGSAIERTHSFAKSHSGRPLYCASH